MRNLLLTVAVLLSSAASAQVQFRFTNNTDTLRFGKNGCGNTVSATWTRTTTNLCAGLTVWLTREGSCTGSGADSSADYALSDISQTTFLATTSGTLTFNVANLPFDTGDGGSACGASADETTFRLCGATRQTEGIYGTCGSTVVLATPGKLVYDGKPPDAPVFSAVAGLDGAARVTLTTGSGDAVTERLEVWLNGERVREVTQAVGKGAIQVDGLQNQVEYELRAYATDGADNTSETPSLATVTPIKTYGFLEEYGRNGGQETGGCGAGSGGIAGGAVLAVLGFWLFSRRNRSWLEQ